MSLVVPPGYGLAAINIVGPDGTEPYVTTIGVSTADAGGDFTAIADRVLAAYILAFSELTNDQLFIDRVSLYVGSDGPSGSVDSTFAGVQGGREVEMAPTAMSLIGRKQTNYLGREGRGRMFLPGLLADGDVNARGAIESASIPGFLEAMQDFGEALVDTGTMSGPIAPPYLLHSDRPGAPAPSLITSLTPAPLVGWIRGRIR